MTYAISFLRTFCCTSTLLVASIAQAAELTITVNDIEEASGKLMVQLVDSEAAYNGNAPRVRGEIRDITNKQPQTIDFKDLKPGVYAISIMHDENGNGKLDSNILGIPKESYGFSNNPRVMRKPTFDEAKFEVKAGSNNIVINLL